jgi:hypothetical protein
MPRSRCTSSARWPVRDQAGYVQQGAASSHTSGRNSPVSARSHNTDAPDAASTSLDKKRREHENERDWCGGRPKCSKSLARSVSRDASRLDRAT